MLTNQDIDELLVQAEMEVDDEIEQALRDFFRPDIEREAEMLWTGLPESVKRMVLERNPELKKVVGGR